MSVNASFKKLFRRIAIWAAGPFVRHGITPNQITLAGFAFILLVASPLVYLGHISPWYFFAGGSLFLLGSLADVLDGAVATLSNNKTPIGRVLDRNTDRIADGAMLLAVGGALIQQGHFWPGMAAFAAIVTSGSVSYSKATIESEGVDSRDVLGERLHRLIALIAGLMLAPLAIWTPFSWWTPRPWFSNTPQIGVYVVVFISVIGFLMRMLDGRKKL